MPVILGTNGPDPDNNRAAFALRGGFGYSRYGYLGGNWDRWCSAGDPNHLSAIGPWGFEA
jgi:hypothetical protein